MKKALTLLVIFFMLISILTLSMVLTHPTRLTQTASQDTIPFPSAQQGDLLLLQDTPEHVLDSFYADLLVKDHGTAMAPLFYQREHYTPMVTDAFFTKVNGYQDHPVYTRRSVSSPGYALYTVHYTLTFKDVNEPVPFLDVLPLIKQDGKWYIFIENPTGTPLEQAVTDLYADPTYTQAEADHSLQLQTLMTKYPVLSEALS